MRFKIASREDSGPLVLTSALVICLTSPVLASPILLKPALVTQTAQPETQPIFCTISEASAGVDIMKCYALPAGFDSDIGINTETHNLDEAAKQQATSPVGAEEINASPMAISGPVVDTDLLSRRHNYAFVCYDPTSKGTDIDKASTDHCMRSYGYGCRKDGGRTSTKSDKYCDEDCKCIDLYPKSKLFGGVILDVNGANKRVSKARHLDSEAARPIIKEVDKLGDLINLKEITPAAEISKPLVKRHNWAFVCYKVNPSAFPDIAELDSTRRNDCVQKNGYSCTKTGKLEADKNDALCNLYCRCKDLFPTQTGLPGCAIDLVVGPAALKICISRRDIIPKIHGSEANPGANADFDESVEDAVPAVKRHSYAVVCYNQDPFTNKPTLATVDTNKERECVTNGFSCDSRGDMFQNKKADAGDCYTLCKCEDIYPIDKLWANCAILLTVMGAKRCIDRREIQPSPGPEIHTITLTEKEAESLIQQHNFVLSCYDKDPWIHPNTAISDTTKGEQCLALGFKCDEHGDMHDKIPTKVNCFEVCKCEHVHPQDNFPAVCAISLTVRGVKKCISPRDLDLAAPFSIMDVSGLGKKPPVRRDLNLAADVPTMNFTVPQTNLLLRRHNYALVCYVMDAKTQQPKIDTTLSRTCLSVGYSCDSNGQRTTKTRVQLCDQFCGCENLYPKSKLWAACGIVLAIAGSNRCISRRDVYAEIETGKSFNEAIDTIGSFVWSEHAESLPEKNRIDENRTDQSDSFTGIYKDDADASMDLLKLERRVEVVQQNTTVSLNATISPNGTITDDESSASSQTQYVNCQDPLMTIRCLIEVGGYSCEGASGIWSIWDDTAAQIGNMESFLEPDWRTCNCVCTCSTVQTSQGTVWQRDLQPSISVQALERVHAFELQCTAPISTQTCADSQYVCDHRGRLRHMPSGSLNPICESSCQCVIPSTDGSQARRIPQELTNENVPKFNDLRSNPKVPTHQAWVMDCQFLSFTKHCAIDKHVRCSDAGLLYVENKGSMDQNCAAQCTCQSEAWKGGRSETLNDTPTLSAEPSRRIGSEPKRDGKYVIDCDILTQECAGTDHVACSDKGILHSKEGNPIDEACAMHCRCEWVTWEGKRSDAPPLPALFHYDATFKETRHSALLSKLTRRQKIYNINDKTHQCDALLYGAESWTLLCQCQPPDYLQLTQSCSENAGFWCPWGNPTLSYDLRANPGTIRICQSNCICYKRYDHAWKRDLQARGKLSPATVLSMGSQPSSEWAERKAATTTVKVATTLK